MRIRAHLTAFPAFISWLIIFTIPGPVGEARGQESPSRSAAALRQANPNFPIPWWREISKKPDSWYRSEAGLAMATNILSWQDDGTGWPLMNTTREPFTGDASRAGPWGTRAALIKATVNEMRFLARGYRATTNGQYRTAVIGGLDYILEAQYSTGGWPHSYPFRTNHYSRYATFNDDLMTDVMTLLQEVVRSRDFRLLDSTHRQRAAEAYNRGIDFILESQIVVDGTPTAWGQQHDEVTYEPRPARAFEPAAISGGESAGVLKLLMEVKDPSPDVIRAIEAGVQWYRDVQINGLEVIKTADDCRVRSNADAPPLWARFYEIGSNKPIFAGRDGIIRFSLAEIEQERRRGYAWYNRNGTDLFRRYEEWRHALAWRDLPTTNTEESKVRDYTLPDPLVMADGEPVASVSDWEDKRRPELFALFEQNQFGVTPSTPVDSTVDIIERDVTGMGGAARRTQVRIRFTDDPDEQGIRVLLNVPADAEGPVPTLLYLGFSPNVLVLDEPGIDEGMAWSGTLKARVPDRDAFMVGKFNARYFIERGFGIAMVYYGDIEPDFDHGGQHGVRLLFGADGGKRRPDEWGSIGGWSWGLSRVMDYLQTDPAVDGKRVALAGVSRLGKTVLWAGAQDQRFALVMPLVSGEGGAAISRRNFGETVADLTNPARYDYWYAPRYADYAFDVDVLPVDGHLLVSLIAPRPVLLVVGAKDTWSDPMGEWVSAKAAEPVYTLYGLSGPDADAYPEPNTSLMNDLGFFLHEAGHGVFPEDLKAMADFMDRHFTNSRQQWRSLRK